MKYKAKVTNKITGEMLVFHFDTRFLLKRASADLLHDYPLNDYSHEITCIVEMRFTECNVIDYESSALRAFEAAQNFLNRH